MTPAPTRPPSRAPTPLRAKCSRCATSGRRSKALDNRIPASVQYTAMSQTTRLLRHMSYWLLENRRGNLDIERAVRRYAAPVARAVARSRRRAGATAPGRLSAQRSQLDRAARARAARHAHRFAGNACTARWTWSKSAMAGARRDRICGQGVFRHRRAHRTHLDQGANREPARRGPLAGGRARHVERQPVRPAAQDHRRGARVQGPRRGGAGRSVDAGAIRPRRFAETYRRRSAHRRRRRISRRCPSPCRPWRLAEERRHAEIASAGIICRAGSPRIPAGAAHRHRGRVRRRRQVLARRCANANHKGRLRRQLFASPCCRWAWVTRYLRRTSRRRRRDSRIHHPVPGAGAGACATPPPPGEQIESSQNAAACGRGRIRLHVDILRQRVATRSTACSQQHGEGDRVPEN